MLNEWCHSCIHTFIQPRLPLNSFKYHRLPEEKIVTLLDKQCHSVALAVDIEGILVNAGQKVVSAAVAAEENIK